MSSDMVKALKALSSDIVAVASRDIRTSEAFARDLELKNCATYGSYEVRSHPYPHTPNRMCFQELTRDANVEIVYVGTIHPFHYQHSILALAGGKHVLCEKPFAMNARYIIYCDKFNFLCSNFHCEKNMLIFMSM
jgi:dihydrodiol dehydrogenase / D-xylose 1-dehydrogenase (NADP)